ncbi:MAG: hypothetical protein ACYDC6_04885 [Acidobacteriaceae bacterium]
MDIKPRYISLWIGLALAAVAAFDGAKITYYSHCWSEGFIFFSLYFIVAALGFRKMRSVYLQMGPHPELSEVKDFNRKAKSFVTFNGVVMVAALFALGWIHR